MSAPQMLLWFILLRDHQTDLLPQAQVYRDRAQAERAQQRHPGSRLREYATAGP